MNSRKKQSSKVKLFLDYTYCSSDDNLQLDSVWTIVAFMRQGLCFVFHLGKPITLLSIFLKTNFTLLSVYKNCCWVFSSSRWLSFVSWNHNDADKEWLELFTRDEIKDMTIPGYSKRLYMGLSRCASWSYAWVCASSS